MATIGPVEYVVIGFPGNRFKGEIVQAIRDAGGRIVAGERIPHEIVERALPETATS